MRCRTSRRWVPLRNEGDHITHTLTVPIRILTGVHDAALSVAAQLRLPLIELTEVHRVPAGHHMMALPI